MSSEPAKAILIVTPRNEAKIRLLVNNTPSKYPILYDPKSGVNLRLTTPAGPPGPPDPHLAPPIQVPAGADCTNLVRLHALGCFELVSGSIFDTTVLDEVRVVPNGEIYVVFNQDIYTELLAESDLVVKVDDKTLSIDPVSFHVVNIDEERPNKFFIIRTTENLSTDHTVSVELRSTGAAKIFGEDDVAVAVGTKTTISESNFSSDKELTAFSVGYIDAGTTTTYPGVLDEENHTITMTAQLGTDRSTFFQEFTVSEGARVIVPDFTVLESGVANDIDYSSPVPILVQAQDGTVQQWLVTCGIATE